MRNQVVPYPQSRILNWTNNTAAPVLADRPVFLGALGFGMPVTTIPVGALGAVHLAGRFTFAKATGGGTALAVGEQVGWDFANNRLRKGAFGLGVVTRAAADADVSAEVELTNLGELGVRAVGNASGAGATVDFGTGITPPNGYTVTVIAADGTQRVVSSVTALTGPAGRVTIVTAAGAGTDVVLARALY